MNAAQTYINRARQRGRMRHPEQFHGFVDDNYRGFVNQPNNYMLATGGAAQVKPSLAYSIAISSASAAAVNNFDIFGASQYLNNALYSFNTNGDLVIGAVTITSTTPGITYRDLLYQTLTQPFTNGMTYIQCSSPVAQILVPYTITTKDSTGVLMSIPGKPKKDPYQQQSDLLIDSSVWSIDGLSKMTFNQILPFAVLNLDFYAQTNVNQGRLLNGQQPGKDYGNPGIIRSNTAVIPVGGGSSNFSGPGGSPGGVMVRTRL
jgi:hypothetical protein